MSKEVNSSKCLFNDVSFCKYRDRCRKKHYTEKCRQETCDETCTKRHPNACKHEENCKFYKKNICAYDHDNLAKRATKVSDKKPKTEFEDKVIAMENKFMLEVKELKSLCDLLRSENEEIKRHNEKKLKEVEEKCEEVNDIKRLFINVKKEMENLKQETKCQAVKINSLEKELREKDKVIERKKRLISMQKVLQLLVT